MGLKFFEIDCFENWEVSAPIEEEDLPSLAYIAELVESRAENIPLLTIEGLNTDTKEWEPLIWIPDTRILYQEELK